MERNLLKVLESKGSTVHEALKNYNVENEKVFKLTPVDLGVYKSIWQHLINILVDGSCFDVKLAALSTLKILSRSKENLNETVTSLDVEAVLTCAQLNQDNNLQGDSKPINYDVVSGAQKCLSNLIFNSKSVQQWCSKNQFIPGLMNRLKNFKNTEIPHEVRWFDIRLVFLISGVVESTRMHIRTECGGFSIFIELLEYILSDHHTSSSTENCSVTLTDKACDLCNESLKTLYNILHSLDRVAPSVEDENHCSLLVSILRKLLLSSAENKSKHEDLISNSVNLLLLMPPHLHKGLLKSPKQTNQEEEIPQASRNSYSSEEMAAINVILDFLKKRLNDSDQPAVENLAPVLSLLIEIALNNRAMRKFIRQRILPPLKDVSKRPEEGDHIRNKLCALMTSPIPQLKTTSADLLFILCKEKVGRLIKYAGYGNAAGFLASRGLMTAGKSASGDYSTDSDDSDTEEYERVKDQVNPVTGRLEPERASPFEGMTEEQKETEAMKLVNALDKLNRANIIQPCVIGDDGKPKPLSHVNELLDKSD